MTRKDYVAIAKAFALIHERDVFADENAWLALRAGIADVFAADNPQFDRLRFYAACEVTP